ncbi:MAG TPA: hypothetical protein DHN29_20830 [Cytophagales bacterium]|jgi:hypothetical protein|nr:hypothetical protein [Cytophagales bacterium]|tara:strand:- start:158 stop:346 length:189 start_codon:yes stop_codon:yes gene_type:complete
MKLYEIPKESKIYVESSDGSKFIIFYHIDGMYSYCETEKGAVVHLSASAELARHEDGYKIKV